MVTGMLVVGFILPADGHPSEIMYGKPVAWRERKPTVLQD